jgi:hypothetical protein
MSGSLPPGFVLQAAPQQNDGTLPPGFVVQPPEPIGAGGRFMHGVGDVPAGFDQFMANVTPDDMKPTINAATTSPVVRAIPGIGLAARFLGNMRPAQEANTEIAQREAEYGQRRQAAGSSGIDWARLGGNVAAGLPLAVVPAGASLPSAAAIGAALGGGMGAIAPQPEAENNDYTRRALTSAALGAGAGAVGGAAGNMIGRVVAPKIDPNVRRLADAGVELTPGQIVGGTVRKAEDAATSIPVVGTGVANAQRRSLESFNRVVGDEVLKPLGKTVPKNTPAGRELITHVDDVISRAYSDALGRVKPFVPDQQFVQDYAALLQNRTLMPDQTTFYNKVLTNQVIPRLQKAGQIDGQLLQTMQSDLKRLSRGFSSSQSIPDQELGRAFLGLSGLLDDLVMRTNPAVAGDIKAANAAFARMIRMEGASGATGAVEGVFTGPQFAAAVRRADMTPRKQSFARGDALMQELADAGKAVLPSTVPDSGTPLRSMVGLAAGTGAAGMIDPAVMASYLAATGAGRAAYSEPATRAFRAAALAQRPEVVMALGEALRRGGQTTGAPMAETFMNQTRR